MGVGGQRHAPVALPPGKVRYPLFRRLGELQSRSGQVRKISPPPHGIRSPDLQVCSESPSGYTIIINPLNAELNPIYHLLALLGAHHILHISRIRVNYVCGFKC